MVHVLKCVKMVAVACMVVSTVGAGERAIGLSFWKDNPLDSDTVNLNISVVYGPVAHVRGCDLSLLGIADARETMAGLQVGGVAAWAKGTMTGYQAAGGVAFTDGDVVGIQAAGLLSRATGHVRGGQSGFINIAKNVYGFQSGFINVSDTMKGIPLGIINVAKNGRVRMVAYGSNVTMGQIGVQFLVNGWCSSIGLAGGFYKEKSVDDAGFFTSFGYRFPLGSRGGLLLDGASVIVQRNLDHYQASDSEWLKDNVLSSSQLRLTGDLMVTKSLSLFVGGGVALNLQGHEGDDIRKEYFDGLVMAGITLF